MGIERLRLRSKKWVESVDGGWGEQRWKRESKWNAATRGTRFLYSTANGAVDLGGSKEPEFQYRYVFV